MTPIHEHIAYLRDATPMTREQIAKQVGCAESKVVYVLMEMNTVIPFWRSIIKTVNKQGGIAC